MTRTQLVRLCIQDACNGECHTLMGLVDWLVIDHGYPLKRIIDIAERRFGIPKSVSIATLEMFA